MGNPFSVNLIEDKNGRLKEAANHFRAINNALRRKILVFIHDQDGANVTQIWKGMKISQSVASQQLAILRKARLVKTEYRGKFCFYKIEMDEIILLHSVAEKLLTYKENND